MEKCDVGPVDPAVEGDRLRSLQIVQMKAEMRMLLEGARSADATWGGGEFDPLQFVLDHIQLSHLVDGRKAMMSTETLGIVVVAGPPVARTTVETAWERFKDSQKMVKSET